MRPQDRKIDDHWWVLSWNITVQTNRGFIGNNIACKPKTLWLITTLGGYCMSVFINFEKSNLGLVIDVARLNKAVLNKFVVDSGSNWKRVTITLIYWKLRLLFCLSVSCVIVFSVTYIYVNNFNNFLFLLRSETINSVSNLFRLQFLRISN